ncbi:MAG: hypothetical protein QOD60_371 [Solirubrobacterales bacterium]|nr:hypothetical protein [Solirubrobacterales bacterium]
MLEFAGEDGGVHAWIGRGVPGVGEGEKLVIIREGDRIVLAEAMTEGAPLIEVAGAVDDAPLSVGPAKLNLERNGTSETLSGRGALSRPPAADGAGLARSILALGTESASLALRSDRPPGADLGAERTDAWLLDPGAEPLPIGEPLLSTQYDQAGAATRATLELWVGDSDELPLRGAGIRQAGVELDLDGWRFEAAFYRWTIEGAESEGSYMIWRAK